MSDARAEDVTRWFPLFAEFHKRLHPHQGWDRYEGHKGGQAVVYAGWVRAFQRHAIDRETAIAASRALQETGLAAQWPEHHLPALVAEAQRIKARLAAEAEAGARARRDRERELEAEAEAELTARWEALADRQRAELRAAVEAEHPSLTRWPVLIRRLAVARMAELDVRPPASPRRKARAG